MPLKIRAILVVVIGVVMGLSLSIGGGLLNHDEPPTREELAWEQARLFAEVLERVKLDYVETVDDATLLESAIRGMVSDLDPHSEYLDANEYRDIRNSTTGSYTGVGIEVAEKEHQVPPEAISFLSGNGLTGSDFVENGGGFRVGGEFGKTAI